MKLWLAYRNLNCGRSKRRPYNTTKQLRIAEKHTLWRAQQAAPLQYQQTAFSHISRLSFCGAASGTPTIPANKQRVKKKALARCLFTN
jgi:hypothetical protein